MRAFHVMDCVSSSISTSSKIVRSTKVAAPAKSKMRCAHAPRSASYSSLLGCVVSMMNSGTRAL